MIDFGEMCAGDPAIDLQPLANDLFGGDLMRGNVHRDGEWADYHWWNRVGDGLELDLTREQFASNELVGHGEPASRPTGRTRLDTEYETLRKRVLKHLKR